MTGTEAKESNRLSGILWQRESRGIACDPSGVKGQVAPGLSSG